MDDGLDRANCSAPFGAHCFSRAVEYKLDARTKVASVAWQFSFPLNESFSEAERAQKDVRGARGDAPARAGI